jgi:hypothetical protein
VNYKETVVHGRIRSEHLVQLFDGVDSMADEVTRYLREGFLAGDAMLVVITRHHWDAVATRLQAERLSLKKAQVSGQLVVRDAGQLLQTFMRYGLPDRALFDASVGALVRQLRTDGTHLRIYGEMVNLLAAEGDFESAERLEALWNDLSERESFTLFCGYSAPHFGDPRTAEALRSICHAHSRVRSDPRDVLGTFLLTAHGARARGAAPLPG